MITEHQIDIIKDHPDLIHCGALRNSDGSYAGTIECECKINVCEIAKSGYIFSTDKEAIEWAIQLKKDLMLNNC